MAKTQAVNAHDALKRVAEAAQELMDELGSLGYASAERQDELIVALADLAALDPAG